MEVWFVKKTYTAMTIQAIVGATALMEVRRLFASILRCCRQTDHDFNDLTMADTFFMLLKDTGASFQYENPRITYNKCK